MNEQKTNKQTNKQTKKQTKNQKLVDKKIEITCQNDSPECQVGVDSSTDILWNTHGGGRDEEFDWLSFIEFRPIHISFLCTLPLLFISIGPDYQGISLLQC